MEKSKKRNIFTRLSLLIFISGVLLFASCSKEDNWDEIIIDPPLNTYSFYIVNEGQMGKTMGSISEYNYYKKTLVHHVLTFGNTTCYGDRWHGNLYFMSKQGKRLCVVDEQTMTEVGSIEEMNDGRAFVGITKNVGVVTTSKGAYVLDILNMKLVKNLEKTENKQCGGVFVHDNHLFVLQQELGVLVYDIQNDFTLVRELGMASVGFAQTKDGSLWAANNTELLKINPQTLNVEKVTLPEGVKIINSWGGWNKGGFAASKRENVLWFIKAASMWGGGNEIYRYEIGKPESLEKPFIKSTNAEDDFYGSGIAIDPARDIIVATFTKKYDYNDNRLVLFDSKTGEEKERIVYNGYFFPGMIIFNWQ